MVSRQTRAAQEIRDRSPSRQDVAGRCNGQDLPKATLREWPRYPMRQATVSYANRRKVSTTVLDSSSRFLLVMSSWPAPATGSSSVRAGMSFIAAESSSIEPKPSRVP